MDKKVLFISESEGSHLDLASTAYRPKARIVYNKLLKATKNLADTIIDIADFIDIKGMKAQGNQLTKLKIKEVLPEIPEGGEEPWPEEQAVEPVIDAESDTTEDTDEGESPTMEWDMTNDDDQPKLF